MNRRNFLKSCTIAGISIPFVSIASSGNKRSEKSLFTIEEMRLWCKMNGFHYVEDDEILNKNDKTWIKDDEKWVMHNGRYQYRLLHKEDIFSWKDNKENRYENLRNDALCFKTKCKKFYFYDIIDNHLKFSYGGIHSTIYCTYDSQWRNIPPLEDRIKNTKIYCIKDRCWYKAVNDKEFAYDIYGFEKVI